mmetsp:Transcript_8099/g.19585  ORF Transcript_8099/g.19585 Transcript_8099/m.19585 type:complete len:239 (-) Transcript_8099:520-1236(-)
MVSVHVHAQVVASKRRRHTVTYALRRRGRFPRAVSGVPMRAAGGPRTPRPRRGRHRRCLRLRLPSPSSRPNIPPIIFVLAVRVASVDYFFANVGEVVEDACVRRFHVLLRGLVIGLRLRKILLLFHLGDRAEALAAVRLARLLLSGDAVPHEEIERLRHVVGNFVFVLPQERALLQVRHRVSQSVAVHHFSQISDQLQVLRQLRVWFRPEQLDPRVLSPYPRTGGGRSIPDCGGRLHV